MEEIKHGEKFIKVGSKICRRKNPLVVLKAGPDGRGQKSGCFPHRRFIRRKGSI